MEVFQTILLWLDAEPVRYWFLAWISFGAAVALAVGVQTNADGKPGIFGRILFISAIFVSLAAFRWPAWFEPRDLNPDEAQTIAGAITLKEFPVYWKYVDGTTHGPFCEYPLVLAAVLGAPLNYVTARVIAVLLQAIALVAVYGTFRCLTTERNARLGVLPGLAFWCFVFYEEYIHYSTELPGVALLALSGWALVRALTNRESNTAAMVQLYLGGLALGAVPYAKLQSVPHALGVALAALIAIWWTPQGRKLAKTLWLVAGGFSISVFIGGFLTVYGLLNQFWAAYIMSNFGYSGLGPHSFGEMPSRFFSFSAAAGSFSWLFFGALSFSLLYSHRAKESVRPLRTCVAISWILLGLAYFTVIVPGREVPHYLHLLVVPVITLAGFILASVMPSTSGAPRSRWHSYTIAVAFLSLTVVPQIHHRIVAWNPSLGSLRANLEQAPSGAAQVIFSRLMPGDTLAMWGWEPHLFVETGLAHATRESHTAFQLTATPLQDFYRTRYLRDLQQRAPVWFVDAVGPGGFIYEARDAFAHESFPELRYFIAANYEMIAEDGNKRIYRRFYAETSSSPGRQDAD